MEIHTNAGEPLGVGMLDRSNKDSSTEDIWEGICHSPYPTNAENGDQS